MWHCTITITVKLKLGSIRVTCVWASKEIWHRRRIQTSGWMICPVFCVCKFVRSECVSDLSGGGKRRRSGRRRQKPDGVRMFMSRCLSLCADAFFPSAAVTSRLEDLKLAGSSTARFTWVLMPSRVVDFWSPKHDCRLNPPASKRAEGGKRKENTRPWKFDLDPVSWSRFKI